MKECVGLVAEYAKRLSRRFSAAAIAWLPVAAVLYVTRSAIGSAATDTLFFGSFAVGFSACWMARD